MGCTEWELGHGLSSPCYLDGRTTGRSPCDFMLCERSSLTSVLESPRLRGNVGTQLRQDLVTSMLIALE